VHGMWIDRSVSVSRYRSARRGYHSFTARTVILHTPPLNLIMTIDFLYCICHTPVGFLKMVLLISFRSGRQEHVVGIIIGFIMLTTCLANGHATR
jgi:hypothetical protein